MSIGVQTRPEASGTIWGPFWGPWGPFWGLHLAGTRTRDSNRHAADQHRRKSREAAGQALQAL